MAPKKKIDKTKMKKIKLEETDRVFICQELIEEIISFYIKRLDHIKILIRVNKLIYNILIRSENGKKFWKNILVFIYYPRNYANICDRIRRATFYNMTKVILYFKELRELSFFTTDSFEFKHDIISKLKKLKKLNLSGIIHIESGCNNVNSFQVDQVSNLKVEEIYLSSNYISNVDHLNHLPNLKVLDLSHNNIESFFQDNVIPTLEILNLSYNRIQGISISGFSRLKRLNLSHNFINEMSTITWDDKEYPNLKMLNLSKNLISKIETISRFSSLEILNLSFNNITDLIPIIELRKLRKCDISHNACPYSIREIINGVELIE